jgi:hypothetical protein
MLCEKDGHQTYNCSSLPELRNLIPLNPTPSTLTTVASTAATTPHSSSKGLQTKFACAICLEYGHYTHHCPALFYFWQTLAAVCQSFQNEPNPTTSSLQKIIDIHYVTTSVNEHMRFPCSLCESLDHFTYQCPMIIEYKQHQLTLIQTPTKSMVDLTSSLEILHIISLEPEALPTPPWFLDDLSKDSPPNTPQFSHSFPYGNFTSNYHWYSSVLQYLVYVERTIAISLRHSPCFFITRGQPHGDSHRYHSLRPLVFPPIPL